VSDPDYGVRSINKVRELAGLEPFGLAAPAKLLVPGPPHNRRNHRVASIKIGAGEDAATVEVTTWDRCHDGCHGSPISGHEAGRAVTLKVPCENLPHCQSCECGDGHRFTLTDEDVAALKGILP
jgi:hypothetical protein